MYKNAVGSHNNLKYLIAYEKKNEWEALSRQTSTKKTTTNRQRYIIAQMLKRGLPGFN